MKQPLQATIDILSLIFWIMLAFWLAWSGAWKNTDEL